MPGILVINILQTHQIAKTLQFIYVSEACNLQVLIQGPNKLVTKPQIEKNPFQQ